MKKFLVVCAAATLCCSLVNAQEAEDTGRGAGLSIIPRLDAGIYRSREDQSTSFNFGNTSLYTLFEGNISEKWSFSLCNHWVAGDWGATNFTDGIVNPTSGLYQIYKPMGGTAANNFMDWAYVSFAPGNFEFSLGKMPMLIGGFEFDEYDFDVHAMATSIFWNTFTVYQTAFQASWTTPSERTTFSAQISTDQYNHHLAYGLRWQGEYGPFSTNWSAVLARTYESYFSGPVQYYPILSFGNRLTLGDFSLTADFISRCGDPDYELADVDGHTLLSTFAYAPSESFNMAFRCAWNQAKYPAPDAPGSAVFDRQDFLTTSLQANWFPVPDDDMLRIQFCAGLMDKDPFAILGMTWNFGFKIW